MKSVRIVAAAAEGTRGAHIWHQKLTIKKIKTDRNKFFNMSLSSRR
jgi:hypothetical protein